MLEGSQPSLSWLDSCEVSASQPSFTREEMMMKREFSKAFKEAEKLAQGRAFSVSIEHDSWNDGVVYHVYIAAPHDNESAYVHVYSTESFDTAIFMARSRLVKIGLLK